MNTEGIMQQVVESVDTLQGASGVSSPEHARAFFNISQWLLHVGTKLHIPVGVVGMFRLKDLQGMEGFELQGTLEEDVEGRLFRVTFDNADALGGVHETALRNGLFKTEEAG